MLLNKYYEKVQTIYIDPPFNKEQEADYLYKVGYKDATWITMLENRIRLGRDLLNERGSIFVRCDYINCCIYLSSGQKRFLLKPLQVFRGQRGGAPLLNSSSLSNSNRRTLSLNHQTLRKFDQICFANSQI